MKKVLLTHNFALQNVILRKLSTNNCKILRCIFINFFIDINFCLSYIYSIYESNLIDDEI